MKRILALALAALLLLPALPVFAESADSDSRLTNTDGFVYVVAEDGTADHRLLWYSPTAKVKQYTVPEDVRIIGQEAFVNCKQLKEVTLPEGVEEIRASAFQGCTGIKSFTLPASLSLIEKTAFQKDAIKQGLIGATYTVPAGSYAEEFCRAYGLKTQTK